MKLRMLDERVAVVNVTPKEKKTDAGIIIPTQSPNDLSVVGRVVEVGTGKRVKVGDTVLYDRRTGHTTTVLEGVTYAIMPETNVLAVIEG